MRRCHQTSGSAILRFGDPEDHASSRNMHMTKEKEKRRAIKLRERAAGASRWQKGASNVVGSEIFYDLKGQRSVTGNLPNSALDKATLEFRDEPAGSESPVERRIDQAANPCYSIPCGKLQNLMTPRSRMTDSATAHHKTPRQDEVCSLHLQRSAAHCEILLQVLIIVTAALPRCFVSARLGEIHSCPFAIRPGVMKDWDALG